MRCPICWSEYFYQSIKKNIVSMVMICSVCGSRFIIGKKSKDIHYRTAPLWINNLKDTGGPP